MRLEWQNWGRVEEGILKLGDDAAYLALWERKRNRQEVSLGRCRLEAQELLPWLPPAGPGSEESPLEDDFDDEEGLPENEGTEKGSLASAMQGATPEEPTRAQLLVAACRYVQALAVRSVGDEEVTRFRLRAFADKGSRAMDGGCFSIKNLEWSPPPIEPLPVPDSMQLVVERTDFGRPGIEPPAPLINPMAPYSALGTYYSQFGQVVITNVQEMQRINMEMIHGLYEQLRDSHRQRDNLVATIIELRSSQVLAAEATLSDAQLKAERNRLAEKAIQELGESARAYLNMRGLSPDLLEIVEVLGSCPDLVAALRDPSVRALMRDQNNLKLLAGMLRQLGQQALAMSLQVQNAQGQNVPVQNAQPAAPAGGGQPMAPSGA